jgi:hypothetical protein
MQALAGVSPWLLVGVALLGALGGALLRHLWGVRNDRANASRIAALRDQLDLKDRRNEGLRLELQAERERVVALHSDLDDAANAPDPRQPDRLSERTRRNLRAS